MIDENLIASLAKRKIVTDTFRRLDPEKKKQVYSTAVRLFGEYGYDGLPVDRFCVEAGISKGSFFQYFPSKSHLLEFALLSFDFEIERWVTQVRKEEKAVHARDRLRYLLEVIVVEPDLTSEQKRFYQFASHALQHSGISVAGVVIERHIQSLVSEIILRGMQTGELRGDIPSMQLAELIQALVRGLTDRAYLGGETLSHETSERFISAIFDGVKA
jgi:AcrR family transcriptional regulator